MVKDYNINKLRIDIFKPKHEPARSLYEVFQEAAAIEPRDFEAEELAVYNYAVKYAKDHDLRVPLLSEVRDAARYASGHVDFGAKWAYAVVRLLESEG